MNTSSLLINIWSSINRYTMSEKLTKKQQKALQFRKKVSNVNADTDKNTSASVTDNNQIEKHGNDNDNIDDASTQTKKKRKTRRGKGKNKKADGNRFLVFVGGLPNNVTPNELQAHFKSASPDHIRIRNEKHIAFLEFDGNKDPTSIQRRMDLALLQTGTILRDGKRLNVELTVGGGGNSKERLEKLRKKNEKLQKETKERLDRMKGKVNDNGSTISTTNSTSAGTSTSDKDNTPSSNLTASIHPDRLRLLKD